MDYFKYIIVILVYRNTDDLEECLESINRNVSSYKSIVVNAYYDESTKNEVERIANLYCCDFINIDNKGYSYGNNRGIEYARNHYVYDYIIISNPDIIIEKFDDSLLDHNLKYNIIAPKIIAVTGKAQNPMLFYRSFITEFLIYKGLKKNNRFLFLLGIGISRFFRELLLFVKNVSSQHIYPIYASHGSFVIITKKAIELLNPVYDENVFLFAEELILAKKAKDSGLLSCYINKILIHHKEDGSMKLCDFSLNKELVKSNIYYYENYVKKELGSNN